MNGETCQPCTGGGTTDAGNQASTCSCANVDTSLYTTADYNSDYGCGGAHCASYCCASRCMRSNLTMPPRSSASSDIIDAAPLPACRAQPAPPTTSSPA